MHKESSIKRSLKKYFTILMTLSIYSFFYWSYLKTFLIQAALNGLDLIEISFFHFFSFMSLFSYITCFSINPGQVPADFSIDNISEDYKIPLNDHHVEIDHCIGRITFCDKCKRYRPHRAHHCHNCEICILRFDHHCIWITNCVGLRNHKAFLLFLAYTAISCGMISEREVYIYTRQQENDFILWISLGGSLVLAIGLGLFFIYHFWMVTQNLTTLERTWRKNNIFDMGWQKNLTQVFGKSCFFWFFPIPSVSLNGIQFPIKIRSKISGYLYYNDKFLI